jgi:hypothetical protein
MGAKGFVLAEEGHLVQLWEPANHTAAENTLVVRMENYNHLTAIISYGATPAADGVITVESCNNMTPSVHTPITFAYYKCIIDFETALGDVLGARTEVTVAATGLIPTVAANTMYVIELDADQLISGHIGFRFCQANPTGDSIMSAVAILSGARYASPQSPTAIA